MNINAFKRRFAVASRIHSNAGALEQEKDWRAEVTDKAVLDRIDFTLAELEYRLQQESTTD